MTISTPNEPPRVRRPQQHEVLIQELLSEAKFAYIRDVLLFAAAVGASQNRRVPFTASAGDPIRNEVLTVPEFSDTLIDMIAVNENTTDPEIMDVDRLSDRLSIFEEYANGGLEYIQEQVNVRHQPVDLVVIDLVLEALTSDQEAKPVSVDELLSGVNW